MFVFIKKVFHIGSFFWSVISLKGPEKTPYLGTFHTVRIAANKRRKIFIDCFTDFSAFGKYTDNIYDEFHSFQTSSHTVSGITTFQSKEESHPLNSNLLNH